jgi:DNA-directed RNA polymerase subunit F
MTVDQYIAAYCPAMVSSTGKATFVTRAQEMYSATVLGTRYNEAVAFRAMHDFTCSTQRKGIGGQVTQIQEGRAAMQFAGSFGKIDPLESTSYGQELMKILKVTARSMGLVMGDAT